MSNFVANYGSFKVDLKIIYSHYLKIDKMKKITL